jgi:hypothetical protein
MQEPLKEPLSIRLTCGQCGTSMCQTGVTGTHITYRCDGGHIYTQQRLRQHRSKNKDSQPPNDAA